MPGAWQRASPDNTSACGSLMRGERHVDDARRAAALPQPPAVELGGLDGDLFDFGLSALRHGDFEDSILELGRRLLCLHRSR